MAGLEACLRAVVAAQCRFSEQTFWCFQFHDILRNSGARPTSGSGQPAALLLQAKFVSTSALSFISFLLFVVQSKITTPKSCFRLEGLLLCFFMMSDV
jgi:hypothetical protein